MRIHNAKAAVGFLLLAGGAALCWSLSAQQLANAKGARTIKPAFVLGRPFQVEIGKTVGLPAQKLHVSFERVLEDSRCPKDVDCVWAGQIRVSVAMKKAATKLGTAQLTVQGSRMVTPKSIGKIGPYWVKLIEVAPERESHSAGTAQRITLLVQEKPFATPENGK